MARKNERKKQDREEQLPTTTTNQLRDNSRRFRYWRIVAIILLLILVAATAGLVKNYKSSSSRECYSCIWIARQNGTTLSEDPCGRDQRTVNSTVKKCRPDQQVCGSLYINLSFFSEGSAKKIEFAFIRDCFTEYPLSYEMNLENPTRTYYGTREGKVYPNIGGRGINMTVVGKQCIDWDLCNSNHPKVNFAASFLDSTTIFQAAKATVSHVLKSVMEFINQSTIYFEEPQKAAH